MTFFFFNLPDYKAIPSSSSNEMDNCENTLGEGSR